MKLTGKCPDWLTLSEDRAKFIPIKGNAEIIRQIFKMKTAGDGSEKIARQLNLSKTLLWKVREGRDGKPRKRPWKGWRKTYIDKILRNKEVIGEYQPHQMLNG